MSILLTSLEISGVLIRQVKEDGKYIEDRQYECLNKAQLKKVVGWLRKHNDFNVKNIETGSGLLLTITNWQELLKEAEVK